MRPLCLTVCLGVVCAGQAQFGPQTCPELGPKRRCETRIPVRDNALRDTKLANHVLEKQISGCGGSKRPFTKETWRYHQKLSQLFYTSQKTVTTVRQWKIGNKIDCPGIESLGWHLERVQQSWCRSGAVLVLLTDFASSHVGGHIVGHAWPEHPGLQQAKRALHSEVGRAVDVVQQQRSQSTIGWDDKLLPLGRASLQHSVPRHSHPTILPIHRSCSFPESSNGRVNGSKSVPGQRCNKIWLNR